MPISLRFFNLVALLAIPLLAGCSASTKANLAGEAADRDAGISADATVSADAYAAGLPRPAALTAFEASGKVRNVEARSATLDALIAKYAAHYDVPERLVRRVVDRESDFNPAARNRIYWGLMQIRHDTAQTMGYRGPASGLLDAATNLKYAVKYLRGAYLTADGNEDRAVQLYARGYYYDAKRKGLLKETGLRN